jgi:hypothetical protein
MGVLAAALCRRRFSIGRTPTRRCLYGIYDAQVNTQQIFQVGSGGFSYAW